MKHKIKNLLADFLNSLTPIERSIQVHDLSIFFSVLIATLTLRKKKNKLPSINFTDYQNEFQNEIGLINQRFPELITKFNTTLALLNTDLLFSTFEKLKIAYNCTDEDMDDIISWSYQFLKKDIEKAAFKTIGKNKTKIQESDLLFTTQFFTDKYMVKYLVDTSLANIDKDALQNVVVIDCASGGGNFLTYSFERLYQTYKATNPTWSDQKNVDFILNEAIIGYDLDSNLSKIAALSLFVKSCTYAIPSKETVISVFGGRENDTLGFLSHNISSEKIALMDFPSKLEEISSKNKIKVFLTNPPFMGKRDMDIPLKNYLLENFPESKGDLCVSFIQKMMLMMNNNDVLGVVCQNNWLYLSSLKGFRKLFLKNQTLKECIDLGSNSFEDINGEKTNVALCVIGNNKLKTSRFYNLKYKNLNEKKYLIQQNSIPQELIFELEQNQFLKNGNFEFNYQLEHRFDNIEGLKSYSAFANPMQGTSTGNNSEFVKFAWEVNGSPDWKLVSKGGGFSKWMGLNYYKVHWGDNAETIKANKGSALRNINKIATTQLVYSDTGTLGLNVRVLKDKQVFIASGPGIQVLKGDKYAHLAFLNSRIATFLLKLINPKFTISAGYISKLPVADNILDSKLIAKKSELCLALKEQYLKRKLPNFEFQHLCYGEISDVHSFIEKLIIEDIENDYKRLSLEAEIETEIRNKYCFNDKELFEIKSVVGESPFFNKKTSLKITNDKLDTLLSLSLDLNCLSTSRAINGYSVGSESILEDLSYKLDVHPKTIIDLIQTNISFLENTKKKYFRDLLHKIILSELGVKHIYSYTYALLNTHQILDNIKIKYVFLKNHKDLEQEVYSILNNHHRISFFNKPLITIDKDLLTVGQAHSG